MPKETYTPEYQVPTVKPLGVSVMILAPISRYSTGPVITLNGRITASDYVDISGNQVHPLVQMFPNSKAILQDNSPIHTARTVQSWFDMMHFNIFTGQHNQQT
jgi:hypothetical protein